MMFEWSEYDHELPKFDSTRSEFELPNFTVHTRSEFELLKFDYKILFWATKFYCTYKIWVWTTEVWLYKILFWATKFYCTYKIWVWTTKVWLYKNSILYNYCWSVLHIFLTYVNDKLYCKCFWISGACDFETDFCSWVTQGTGSFTWSRGGNQTSSIGPPFDHTIGNTRGM